MSSGEVFADYTIERQLGAGSVSAVYLARHPRMDRRDALKVFDPALTGDRDLRSRVAHDADLASTLAHPNIVGLRDRGEVAGRLWLAMEFVDGTDVARLLEATHPHGVTAGQAFDVVRAVAAALDHAHQRDIVHRNVKPSNVLLGDSTAGHRRVLLADFGNAHHARPGSTATDFAADAVRYAAPEQLMGEPVDGRADQYSLAAIAFHLLTGTPPFSHANLAVLISHHLNTAPPNIGDLRPDLRGAAPALARALAKNPADRYATCQHFVDALTDESDGTAPVAAAPRTPPVTRQPARPPTPSAPDPAGQGAAPPPVIVSSWTAPTARKPTNQTAAPTGGRAAAEPQSPRRAFRVGGRVKVVAKGDDNQGRVGRIHTLFDPDPDDDFDVCLRFPGDTKLYAFRRAELKPLAD